MIIPSGCPSSSLKPDSPPPPLENPKKSLLRKLALKPRPAQYPALYVPDMRDQQAKTPQLLNNWPLNSKKEDRKVYNKGWLLCISQLILPTHNCAAFFGAHARFFHTSLYGSLVRFISIYSAPIDFVACIWLSSTLWVLSVLLYYWYFRMLSE